MGDRAGNIRIAKNTIIVYVRMAVTIIVGLITTRLVFQALGNDNYGLYNVVGSVVMMFGFISSALSGTTQRFLNYEMGRPEGNPGRMFNICNALHIGCAVILFIIIEIIGVIYINSGLRVTAGKEADAMFVFQVSTLVACIGITNVPYQSLFVAYEKFSAVAVIDICLNLVKLGLVALLLLYRGNSLRLYAVFMSVSTLASFIAYRMLSRRWWPETVRWSFVRGKENYRDAFSFNNYNLLSSAAILARSQGSNMLINYFFGTGVNSAYGLANTVNNYVTRFTGNMDFAATPQLTQNYSGGNRDRSHYLAYTVCRASLLAILLVFFTLLPELGFLLRLWIGPQMPEEAPLMCLWMLLFGIASTTGAGLGQIVNASGKIKWFKIEYAAVYAIVLLSGFIAFKAGAPAHTIIIIAVTGELAAKFLYLVLARKLIGYPSWDFARKAYVRPLLFSAVMLAWYFLYPRLGLDGTWPRLLGTLLTLVAGSIAVWFVGLFPQERSKLSEAMSNKVHRIYRTFMLKHFHKTLVDRQWKSWKGYSVDWEHPRDINEKIQWLLCKGDTSKWARCSDKVAVRDYVREKGLGDMLVPLLGVWERASGIDYDSLPEKFVLKCNHDSGSTIIVDKSSSRFDPVSINSALDSKLRVRYGLERGELYYDRIEPRILAEPYLDPPSWSKSLVDYKIWCFNGSPYSIWACYDRTPESVYVNLYDKDWNVHPEASVFSSHYRDGEGKVPRPEGLELMLSAAAALSEGFPQVRVDFYEAGGKVWFGEMTFASLSGKMDYFTDGYLREMGDMCKLPDE